MKTTHILIGLGLVIGAYAVWSATHPAKPATPDYLGMLGKLGDAAKSIFGDKPAATDPDTTVNDLGFAGYGIRQT